MSQAGRQKKPKPSFLAFVQVYGKGDEELPPLAAVTEQHNAAHFTVVAAEAVPPELSYNTLKGMNSRHQLDTTLARHVTLRADGPMVGSVYYDDDGGVPVGEVLPSGRTSSLELKVIAQPADSGR